MFPILVLAASIQSGYDMLVWKQGGDSYAKDKLGLGNSTMAEAGCLVTVFAHAANILNGSNLTPGETNIFLKHFPDTWSGSGLIQEKAAKHLKLRVDEKARIRWTDGAVPIKVTQTVIDTIHSSGLAILHVDHNLKKGGDHFILALATLPDLHPSNSRGVFFSDPATGRIGFLVEDRDGYLVGDAWWQAKRYKVVGVVPIYQATPVPVG